MSKKLGIVLFVVIILLAAFITNPSEKEHRALVKDRMKEFVDEAIDDKMDEVSESLGSLGQLGEMFGKTLGNAAVEGFGDNLVSVDNYFIFSLTKITWSGESRVVGLGLFGQVMVSDKFDEALEEGLEEALDSYKKGN